MSAWHPYPRYFVLPDRSWRGVAFIDDPLDQDGAYVGERDGSFQSGQGGTPDWRDHDEMDRNLYSDGVHRPPPHEHEPDLAIDTGEFVAPDYEQIQYDSQVRRENAQRKHNLWLAQQGLLK